MDAVVVVARKHGIVKNDPVQAFVLSSSKKQGQPQAVKLRMAKHCNDIPNLG